MICQCLGSQAVVSLTPEPCTCSGHWILEYRTLRKEHRIPSSETVTEPRNEGRLARGNGDRVRSWLHTKCRGR